MGETPIPGLPGPEHVSGAGAAKQTPASAPQSEHAGGAAFEALLEKLEVQARELRDDTQSVDNPQELAGAVDRARESLEGALELSEELLEAYRQSMQQRPSE